MQKQSPQGKEARNGGGHLKVPRLDTVDVVKGIAIVLMVFGHTEQGGRHRQWWDAMPRFDHGLQFSDTLVYSFHMPAFFFISGLFLAASVHRRGPIGFTLEKTKTLLYPYLLWGLAFGLTDQFTAQYRTTGHPFGWRSLLIDILSGDASWFLITLFVCQLFALLVIRLPHWFQMILALAGCFFIPDSSITILHAPFLYFPFVVAGMWVGSRRMSMVGDLPQTYAWIGFGILLAVQFAIIALWGAPARWAKVPVGLVGILMLFLFGRGLLHTAGGTIFRWFGEASIAIFLVSPYCQGFAREMVLRLARSTAPLPQLLVPILFASIVPALLWHLKERLHIGWLFQWPSPTKAGIVSRGGPGEGQC
jgi:fucose 4-O-acetylase-like acetyltransferase